ncbi:MAG: hypothetical protein WAN36_01435 [Calditrichia bacterium]
MKNKMKIVMAVCLALLFILWGCESPTDEDTPDPEKLVVVKGQVINQESNSPVDSAVVRVMNYSPETTVITDAAGRYSLDLEVNGSRELTILAYKESFVSDSIEILAVPGRSVDAPLMKLEPTASTPVTSGGAAAIVLAGISNSSIGVRESGSPETSVITFEVQDSTGVPVDLQHTATVNFRIGSTPGGAEFIHPASAVTNNSGQVKVNLFSGLVAGVVQVIAETEVNGNTLRSQPVPVAIHGGMPDSAHFSLAVEKVNFPGYNIYGLTDMITAYVGDKYGNPARPNSAVYFTTDGGLIEGSALSSDLGQASVQLISAAPKPNHATLGAGFATVTGRTADENQNTIEADAIVLFSGIPQISATPLSVSVPNGGAQSFSFMVKDQNDNPLAGGTSISVAVEAGLVEVAGDKGVVLPDTQSKYWTQFGFTLVDAQPDSLNPNPVTVRISTTGPNGAAHLTISGSAN